MKRIAVITGSSSGMGREFALQVASSTEHYKADEIWLIARRRERLEELAAEIEAMKAANPDCPKPIVHSFDIAGKSGAALFNELLSIESKRGGFEITLLVNNAGFGTYGPFIESDAVREMDMIELNCTALTGVCSFALPYMARGSVIINTASLAAYMPLGNFAVYAATKAFVLSFTAALAAEMENRGIRVCAFCPGPVSTEFALVASGGVRKEVRHGASVKKVVRHCLKKARGRGLVAMMKFEWKAAALASKFAPRMLCARITYKFCPREH